MCILYAKMREAFILSKISNLDQDEKVDPDKEYVQFCTHSDLGKKFVDTTGSLNQWPKKIICLFKIPKLMKVLKAFLVGILETYGCVAAN